MDGLDMGDSASSSGRIRVARYLGEGVVPVRTSDERGSTVPALGA